METITIAIGESRGIQAGFLKAINITYCGMPNKEVFSLGIKESSGNVGYSFNIYYPVNTSIIMLKNKSFSVMRITPVELILKSKD